MPKAQNQDPYAPPPMHHDRSGALVRIVIVAALLGVAVWGYASFTGREQTALVPEIAEQQQMADASSSAAPDTLPEATSESLPEAAPAPSAPARRTAPAAQQPAESVPPPSTATTPTSPAPIPPVDVPPAE
jgi:cytoskeletal protein RodZ